jgi:lipid-A-disaccharide synthase
MKYYIIAGEASGDLHASNLIKELKLLDKHATFHCWGGDLMKAQGATIVKHYKDLAFMGFAEVLLNLKTILSNIKFCKKDILEFKPDVLILVDYPGFNLRIAEFAKMKGFKVFYYISPSVWAWHESRVKTIKKYVDKLFVILPFEKEFYAKHDYKVEYAGHPLTDGINDWKKNNPDDTTWRKAHHLNDKPIIAILPGSRKQEISRMFPIMLEACDSYKEYQVIVAGATSIPQEYYRQFAGGRDVKILFNQTYSILKNSDAAIVKSGTSTLEAALLDTPEVVCYKANALSYSIAKRVAKVKYISLVNLIMDREVVKELIQDDMTADNIRKELNALLFDKEKRTNLFKDYQELKNKLGINGASKSIATKMFEAIDNG